MTKPKSGNVPVIDNTILHFASSMSPISTETAEPTLFPNTRIESETFKIRFASKDAQRQSAIFLVEKLYGTRGYRADEEAPPAEEKPDRITLLVHSKENVPVGTITIGPDGPAGLMADELYQPELDAMRSDSGVRLLELTKFAMDRHRGNSKQVLASLLNIAYVYSKMLGCNWMVIEVNPRHVSFYENSLGFRVIGTERTCSRVNAPAVLLGLDLSYTAQQISKFGGRKNDAEAGKSLYRYFLDDQDETGLVQRLLGQK